MKKNSIEFFDRESGKICTETVMGDGALRFAYNTLAGRVLWGFLFNSALPSKWMGRYYDSPKSHKKIPQLAYLPGLRLNEAEKEWQEYNTFNDFFTRKLKPGMRPFIADENVVCSPADGRLLVYPDVDKDIKIPVKGAVRSLETLCAQSLDAKRYHVAVFRLAPVDYHRFHYPCDCEQAAPARLIPGKYHSVNPIAFYKAPDVFVENARTVTELTHPKLGKFLYLDVGAFGVGSIVQTASTGHHAKGDEKGYFKFGGSTVILLFDADKFAFDTDLLTHSAGGMETLIRCGTSIGTITV